MIAANNGYLLAFDNLSGLPNWLSDALCRLATGGSFAVRQLYTDDEEILFEAARPILLNSIEEVVSRPDLGDRAIFLTLAPIGEAQRRPESGAFPDGYHCWLSWWSRAMSQCGGSLLPMARARFQKIFAATLNDEIRRRRRPVAASRRYVSTEKFGRRIDHRRRAALERTG